MFFKRTPNNDPNLNRQIVAVLNRMERYDPETPEYAKCVDQLQNLYTLKNAEKPSKVSKDALITAGASLLGILIIVAYESTHVLTSKAVGFVKKI